MATNKATFQPAEYSPRSHMILPYYHCSHLINWKIHVDANMMLYAFFLGTKCLYYQMYISDKTRKDTCRCQYNVICHIFFFFFSAKAKCHAQYYYILYLDIFNCASLWTPSRQCNHHHFFFTLSKCYKCQNPTEWSIL